MIWDGLLKDLCSFSEALRRHRATERTADALISQYSYFDYNWRGSRLLSTGSSGIPIPPPRNKGLHPTACVVESAEISFYFEVGGEELYPLPYRADFQVKVAGWLDLSPGTILLEDHWRVDCHAFPPDPPPREPHPYIHFQRGGHAQDELAGMDNFVPGTVLNGSNQGFSGLMQSPGPRIPFLPHCPILAIDFALGQHNGDIWRELRGTAEYRKVIKHSQERLWDPFFDALSCRNFREKWVGPSII